MWIPEIVWDGDWSTQIFQNDFYCYQKQIWESETHNNTLYGLKSSA